MLPQYIQMVRTTIQIVAMATASHVNEKQMSREMVEVDKASLHKMILTSTVLYMTIFLLQKNIVASALFLPSP